MNPQEEILALTRELNDAGHRYYVLDEPTMPDYDYDHKLQPAWRSWRPPTRRPSPPDSPTQRVGGEPLESQFQPVVHQVPLESLQDVFAFDELRAFDQRVAGLTPRSAGTMRWSPRWTACRWRWSMRTACSSGGPPAGDGQRGRGRHRQPQNCPVPSPCGCRMRPVRLIVRGEVYMPEKGIPGAE